MMGQPMPKSRMSVTVFLVEAVIVISAIVGLWYFLGADKAALRQIQGLPSSARTQVRA